jgi:hypothetical protein
MNRKAFRCGVLALLLTAAFALPAISQTPGARATPDLHSSRPAAPRGIVERAWDLVSGFFGGKQGGLRAVSGANREGIDPNGLLVNDPAGWGSSLGQDCTPAGSRNG